MPELKGSKTEQNLWTAFAGESQARNKYTYFASKAKKDGFVQISKIFEETAANEKEHAEIWFKLLGRIGSTAENLAAAAEGERTTSGPICTPPWPRRPRRRALTTSHSCSPKLPRSRRSTRSVTASCWPTWRGPGVLQRRRYDLAVFQLRPYPCGQAGAGGLPRLRSSPGLLPAEGGELLIC